MFTLKVYSNIKDVLTTDIGICLLDKVNDYDYVIVRDDTGEVFDVLESMTDENGYLCELTVE